METLISFVPQDRRRALVRGHALPARAVGAALFADISGFTPLTEALVTSLGRQRGAEEISRLLDQVYAALTRQLDQFQGSVIGFSGDAITCWFAGSPDGAGAALRAVTCAAAMQEAMRPFAQTQTSVAGVVASLGLKVAVSAGPAQRFLVGDPAIQRMEVLAGATIDQLALADRHARRGEVVLTPATAAALAGRVAIAELRGDEGQAPTCAVLDRLEAHVAPEPWPPLPLEALRNDEVRQWLNPAVVERLQSGHGLLLNELRPAVAIFISFGDLDYDGDPQAGELLDRYVRWVQRVLARYEGTLLDITMGDKGGYLYAVFGLPQAHADDALRAARAALELRAAPMDFITRTQIGINSGQVRGGTYGGSTRTYGALGEPVNLAARLMQAAERGQVLISDRVASAVADRFVLRATPPLRVKGRQRPVAVSSLVGQRSAAVARLAEPRYTLAMVGREGELAQLRGLLERALDRRGASAVVVGEAGLGKSRLVAEVVRSAGEAGLVCLIGEAPSYATAVPYLAWRAIWRDFFDMRAEGSPEEQIGALARAIESLGPGLVTRMPLLAGLLDLPIADNDLSRGLDARLRKDALEALLVDCLIARARRQPLLLVLEDAHWLDPLSRDLMAALAPALAELPVLLLVATRPTQSEAGAEPLLRALPQHERVTLGELPGATTALLIARKIEALFGAGARAGSVLAARVAALAQGNPFYIEELINFLHDCGIQPDDDAAVAQLALPESLAQLLLGRVDRLTSGQQATLKVASIIGRLFPARWLRGVYPELGPQERVQRDLESLATLELTPLDSDDPELRYLFKHVITQEVIYESLPFNLRAQLHAQLAEWIESTMAASPPIDLLAFHYGRSANLGKQREYYWLAGAAAAEQYANVNAIAYYTRLLALVEGEERARAELELGVLLDRVGDWDAALARYQSAVDALPAGLDRARALRLIGALHWGRSRFEAAELALGQARALCVELGARAELVAALCEMAAMARLRGTFEAGWSALAEARRVAEESGDPAALAQAVFVSGNLAATIGDYQAAREAFIQTIELRRRLGNRFATAAAMNNLGLAELNLGNPPAALALVQEAFDTFREIGLRRAAAIARMTLARVHTALGARAHARQLFQESIGAFDRLGAWWELATATTGLAGATWAVGDPIDQLERALRLLGIVEMILARAGVVLQQNDRQTTEALLDAGRASLGDPAVAAIREGGRALAVRDAVAYILE